MFCSALEPVGREVQVVNVSEGASVELSCMRGIYPSPDKISWWRNDINCDSLQCLVSDLICLMILILNHILIWILSQYCTVITDPL